MRRPFLVLTILAALAAIVLAASKREVRYFSRLAASDLADGRFPRSYMAASVEESNLSPALERFIADAGPAAAAERLAFVEMQAAGVFEREPDANVVSLEYEKILADFPESPLVHYRYAAFLLGRYQMLALRLKGGGDEALVLEAGDLSRRARIELALAAQLDPHNSLIAFETAYAYWSMGDLDAACQWLEQAASAGEFDPGDDAIISAAARLAIEAGAPPLEGLIAAYRLSQYGPSFLANRMESLAAGILSRRDTAAGDDDPLAAYEGLVGLEDLSDKLLQTAEVIRQSQAGLVTAGLLWRTVEREAALQRNWQLRSAARRETAKACYRYLVLGAERQRAGFPPQQGIVELDIPLDLRLPFSPAAQRLAGVLLMFVVVLALPAAAVGIASLRLKPARQLALSLATLAVFAALGYAASFYSTAVERAKAAAGVEARLRLVRTAPQRLRDCGDLTSTADFDAGLAKSMLSTLNYTLQAARVLAHIGTRDCYDAMIEALSDENSFTTSEVLEVLRDETGKDFGYRRGGSRSANHDAIEAWRDWWRSVRETFPEGVETGDIGVQRSA